MTKLKGLSRMDALKKSFPPSTAEKKRKGEGKGLMLMAPDETMQALRVAAAEENTTTRALVLQALKKAGYPVPEDELTDRRRRT